MAPGDFRSHQTRLLLPTAIRVLEPGFAGSNLKTDLTWTCECWSAGWTAIC